MGIEIDADMVLLNGQVITMNQQKPMAEAVAVRDGKFLWIGDTHEVRSSIGKKTLVRNLDGATVVPGFNEAHNHTMEFGLNLSGVPLESARSIGEMIQAVNDATTHVKEGNWIIGRGYNQNNFSERRNPTRWDLDRAAPHHPVSLRHTSSHVMAVNSRALQMAGITRETPDPPGGKIVRDKITGETTGLLLEFPAMDLVEAVMPKPSFEDLVKALQKAGGRLLSEGITSAMDAAVGTNGGVPRQIAAYQEAVEGGLLRVRHNLALWSEALIDYENFNEAMKDLERKLLGMGIRSGMGNEKLRIGPFKLVSDGALSMGTAVTYDPYGADPEDQTTGLFVIDPEKLERVVAATHQLGWQLAVHAIGDRTLDAAITAFEKANELKDITGARPRIEHGVMLTPQMIERIRRLGIILVPQPGFVWGLGDSYINQLGVERAAHTKAFKTLLDNRIITAFSSDRPVIDGAPLLGIHAAVNRKTSSGQDYGPLERISVEDALRCYTLNGAYTTFEENIKGSIEIGKLADLVLLSDNPTSVPPERIKDIQVLATMVDGDFVYDRETAQ